MFDELRISEQKLEKVRTNFTLKSLHRGVKWKFRRNCNWPILGAAINGLLWGGSGVTASCPVISEIFGAEYCAEPLLYNSFYSCPEVTCGPTDPQPAGFKSDRGSLGRRSWPKLFLKTCPPISSCVRGWSGKSANRKRRRRSKMNAVSKLSLLSSVK